jgi:preprotein translocase subunit YajC
MFKSVLIAVYFLFQSTAIFAQSAAPAAAPKGDWSPIMGMLLMVAVFFFLIILPQSRKAKKQTQFLASLQKGDNVVTQSGIFGKIVGIADRVITLEIAPNVKIRIDRQTIAAKDEFATDTKAA